MAQIIDNWRDFAYVTVKTNDLDPMYEVLVKARAVKGDEWVKRYCMNMLLFYHAGQAYQAAEEKWTWSYLQYDFHNLLRGTERRYYRGKQGTNALERLVGLGLSPEAAFDAMWAPTYTGLIKLFSSGKFAGCGFGEYFVWKVLDLQTRVFDREISLSLDEAGRYLPNEPKKCAETIWPDKRFTETLSMVVDFISPLELPFGRGGQCGLQEAETILCMLKGAFLTRKHKVGDDIEDKRVALAGTPLVDFLPPRVLGEYECSGNLTATKSSVFST